MKVGRIVIALENKNLIWDEKELLYAAELWKKGQNIKTIARVLNREPIEVLAGLDELRSQRRLHRFVEIGALKKEGAKW